MSKDEFMRQLEQLLDDVAEEEKREALSYYQSYFEDAGAENEERILTELESPKKVAATIKADLGMETDAGAVKAGLGMETDAGIFTEHGFEDRRFEQKHPISIRKDANGQQSQEQSGPENSKGAAYDYQKSSGYDHPEDSGYDYQKSSGYDYQKSSGYDHPEGSGYDYQKSSGYGNSFSNSGDGRSTYSGRSGMEVLLIIVIAVVTSPIWLGAVAGIGGAVLGLAISVVCVTGAFYITGGVLFGIGIGQLITGSLAVGFALAGVGLLLLALAVLATILCVWVCGKLVLWLCEIVRRLWRSIFSGKEQRV